LLSQQHFVKYILKNILLFIIKQGVVFLFSSRLKYLRENRGLSQLELGNVLNVTQQTINNYEKGKREPSQEMLQKIASYFKVSIDYLFGWSDDPRYKPPQITDPTVLKELEETKKEIERAFDRFAKLVEKHSTNQEKSPM